MFCSELKAVFMGYLLSKANRSVAHSEPKHFQIQLLRGSYKGPVENRGGYLAAVKGYF